MLIRKIYNPFLRYQQCSECTDAHGRLTINLGKQLPVGVHAVKMVVRGDHSYLNTFIAIVPHETRCVVFSIDGSLTGSVSVTGRDPVTNNLKFDQIL